MFHGRYSKKKEHITKEHISNYDLVDRAGYMPVDLQYARLMNAGKKLEEIRDYQYNVDTAKLQSFLENKTEFDKLYNNLSLRVDKTELDTLFKDKLMKLRKHVDSQQEYNRLLKEFNELEKQKQIKQEAINEYKQSLNNQSHKNE